MRLDVEATWKTLEARGEQMPRTAAGAPLVPPRVPRDDDEERGFSFIRTKVGGDWASLSLPRTFFGLSLIERANFHDTDLSESVLCWSDFVEVTFAACVLAGADLRASVFQDCSFQGADLRGADLRRSDFSTCVFTDAKLDGAMVERGASWLSRLSAAQRAVLQLNNSEGDEPGGG